MHAMLAGRPEQRLHESAVAAVLGSIRHACLPGKLTDLRSQSTVTATAADGQGHWSRGLNVPAACSDASAAWTKGPAGWGLCPCPRAPGRITLMMHTRRR